MSSPRMEVLSSDNDLLTPRYDVAAVDRCAVEVRIRNFNGIMCVVSGPQEYPWTLRHVKEAIFRAAGIKIREQRLFNRSMELQRLFGPSELRNSDLISDIIGEDKTADLQMVLQLPEQVLFQDKVYLKCLEEELSERQKLKVKPCCAAEVFKEGAWEMSEQIAGA
eukprot:gnl/MRDRNA2_/MRDRNA2_149497_c0_seq1.p1 gnl/MRDRNA2_/MRDRNA2_149497_c0~~gnl/MRDRNA2_/MRDRNA2_149497_c0_seq1.p1  ORF type:complete len:165 (-),score=40.17 gnl/MRDRNA2_/MRDRNA2_149497_c0_seq1:34-528(-)